MSWVRQLCAEQRIREKYSSSVGTEVRLHFCCLSHRSTLGESANTFPPEFASFRVLPSLVSALEFGGASAATILPLVLRFGKNVSPEDYPAVILAPLVKLFASPDRGTRMALLDHLPEYAEKLDKKTVDSKIWPHLVGLASSSRIETLISE